jgi:uncharacterized protein YbbK (DUF523 family)
VIEGQARESSPPEPAPLQEIQEVKDVTEDKATKAEEKGVDLVEETVEETETKVDAIQEEPVTLANGSNVSPDTVMQCGRCQARFYAKDAPEGSCPATDAASNVCGGVLGPVA